MLDNCSLRMRWPRTACAAIVLSMSFLQAEATNAQSAVAPMPGTARIWFYRDYEPYVSRNYATVLLNGAMAGSVQPYGGVVYRDVPPGHYHIVAESVGKDVNQESDVDLAPGQQVYCKIESLGSWDSATIAATVGATRSTSG